MRDEHYYGHELYIKFIKAKTMSTEEFITAFRVEVPTRNDEFMEY